MVLSVAFFIFRVTFLRGELPSQAYAMAKNNKLVTWMQSSRAAVYRWLDRGVPDVLHCGGKSELKRRDGYSGYYFPTESPPRAKPPV
jgi:hypothetical protein